MKAGPTLERGPERRGQHRKGDQRGGASEGGANTGKGTGEEGKMMRAGPSAAGTMAVSREAPFMALQGRLTHFQRYRRVGLLQGPALVT